MGLPFSGWEVPLFLKRLESALMQVKGRAQSHASMRFVAFEPSVRPSMTVTPTACLPTSARIFLIFGALSACTSVVFSAAFAHLPVFAGGVPVMVQTALSQQQFHSLGLLLVGWALAYRGRSPWLMAAGGLMLAGVLLFSFNLYARAVLGFDSLRALVPWGGGAWILAWLSLAIEFARGFGRPTSPP